MEEAALIVDKLTIIRCVIGNRILMMKHTEIAYGC